MLELALKQERIKYHKLKFGVEPTQNELKCPTTASTTSNSENGNLFFVVVVNYVVLRSVLIIVFRVEIFLDSNFDFDIMYCYVRLS